jgi:hypothetical protein
MGTTTPVASGTVTVTVTPTGDLQLDPNNGDVTMAPGLDTITFNLVNADPDVTARFTNTWLNPSEPDPWYLIRSAGPAGKLSYARNSDTQLTLTDDNQGHGGGQDWMYKYGVRVAVIDGNGTKTILTFDPTIDNEDET